MRTHQQIVDLMAHALGRTPDARNDLWACYNEAGRALYTAGEVAPWFHRWNWRRRENVTVVVPANSESVTLPADFGQLEAAIATGQNPGRVQIVPAAAIQLYRTTNLAAGGMTYLATDLGSDQSSGAVAMRKRVLIYPLSSAERTDIRLTYLADWRELTQESDGGNRPNIPPDWERLLVLLARKLALDLEDQTPSLEASLIPDETEGLVLQDCGTDIDIGKPTYSVGAAARGTIGSDLSEPNVIRN